MQFEILMNVNFVRANIHRMEQEAILLFTHALVPTVSSMLSKNQLCYFSSLFLLAILVILTAQFSNLLLKLCAW